jgi:membrane associated rhomboid family serine protease
LNQQFSNETSSGKQYISPRKPVDCFKRSCVEYPSLPSAFFILMYCGSTISKVIVAVHPEPVAAMVTALFGAMAGAVYSVWLPESLESPPHVGTVTSGMLIA